MLLACASAVSAEDGKKKNMSEVTTIPADIRLRIGATVVNGPKWQEELPAPLEQYNRKVRLEGLPDHLNPAVIDPEKVAAFLKALPQFPAESLKPLAGRTLALYSAGLMLGTSAPTRPAMFTGPMKLEIVEVQGQVVHARLVLKADCELARNRAAEASARIGPASDEIKALEARLPAVAGTPEQERDVLAALSVARRRRSALAYVWQKNAKARAECDSTDATAKADLEAAVRAVDIYGMPLGTGMP